MAYLEAINIRLPAELALDCPSGEHSPCSDCGGCVLCPRLVHYCCCGVCGPKCNHDHEALGAACYYENELNHGLPRRN